MSSNATNRREQLRRQQEAAARQKRVTRIVGVAAGILALVLVAVLVFVIVNNTRPTPQAAQVTPSNVSAAGNALVVGPTNEGKPTVTLYLDYQCPNCKHFEDQYGEALEQGAANGDWTLQFKTLTFMDKNLQNTASNRAAVAAACSAVASPENYAAFNRAVYANQAAQEVRGSVGYTDQLLRVTIPGQVGIAGEALTKYQACYDGRATQDFVTAVEKSAYAEQVTGTPTLAVNGKVLDLRQLTDSSPAGLRSFILGNA